MSRSKIKIKVSNAIRPRIPEYGISAENEEILTWDKVNDWMEESKSYWISTTKFDGKPHARPLWGIWYNNIFYFGGGQKTQNVKNLLRDARITVHTESANNVVIIEGQAEQFHDEEIHEILGKKYEARYDFFHPPPFWRVIPEVVFTWSMDDFANTPTKFICKIE
ncbi:MAG: pyridoxamine 5'-phosphate oxidase family protein [Candidatus Heimdallarchaeota archaeon]|nr:pyridoxamine 5'-phosphate oxidase family protein [Candidatus Heimdallarchaeota archaeon]